MANPIVGVNDLATLYPNLAEEWDKEKNGGLVPESFCDDSTTVVFWRCPTCNGSWRKSIVFRTRKDNGCPYCGNRKVLPGFNDLATKHPDVVDMWLPEENGNVEASEVLYCSGAKYAWSCGSCGSRFTARIRHVVKHGCPECEDDSPKMKGKSLRQLYPQLADEWDEEKNGISADDFKPWGMANSELWWHCPTCGQSYQTKLANKLRNKGCPVCQGKVVVRGYNDIETLRPDVAGLWSDKNGDQKPWMYTTGSCQRAWFTCPECGEARHAIIFSVCNVSKLCRKCAGKKRSRDHIEKHGSLADRYPVLGRQWHRTLNGGVTPDMVSPCSDFDAYWYCEEHDFTWRAKVITRTQAKTIGSCPKCVADDKIRPEPGKSLKDLFPDLANEWDDDGNGDLRPEDFAPNSHMRVSWVCPKCKESYVKRISHRTVYGRGCECTLNKAASFPEKAVFYYVSMAYQDALPNRTPNERFGKMELDIYIPSIGVGIEYDGERWHQDSDKDERKDAVCLESGIVLIRVREPRCPKYERSPFHKEVERTDHSDEALDTCIRTVLRMIGAPDEIDVDTSKDRSAIRALLGDAS